MAIAMLAALAAQVLTPPTGARWLRIRQNERSEYAIDPDSISRRGDRISVVVRLRLLRPQAGEPGIGVMRYEYDCRANTVRSEIADIYGEDGSFTGTVVRPAPQQRDAPIAPDSPNADVLAHLCR